MYYLSYPDLDFYDFVVNFNRQSQHLADNFKAGRISKYISKWQSITSDLNILNIVASGYKIEFEKTPLKALKTKNKSFTFEEIEAIRKEVDILLHKGVIVKVPDFRIKEIRCISPVFTVPKKDGSTRFILNLKNLNENIKYYHFKMESVHSAVLLMTKNCYMASIDLVDFYYSCPVDFEDQMWLCFQVDLCYSFTSMPNGLSSAPRVLTKLMKPVISLLRRKGYLSVTYLDDSLLLGRSYLECQNNVYETAKLLSELGFVIHPGKSVLIPSQQIEFLGFLLDSRSMRIFLPERKIKKVIHLVSKILSQKLTTIQELAETLGVLVSTFPAVELGPLYYRKAESLKTQALRYAKGNFAARIILTSDVNSELQWWLDIANHASKAIESRSIDKYLCSDASKLGWALVDEYSMKTATGEWSSEEKRFDINVLETKAVYLGLKCFAHDIKGMHVRLRSDNITTVAYINKMGGSKSKFCNYFANKVWQVVLQGKGWISAEHVPGVANIADKASRKFDNEKEWKLDSEIFTILNFLVCQSIDIDLFATRLNFQIKPFVSWKPDPECFFVDAFAMNWKHYFFYAFPPFSLLLRTLQKVETDQATGILIFPNWTTQVWYPLLLKLLIGSPIFLPNDNFTLSLPQKPTLHHPLSKTLHLAACVVSGKGFTTKDILPPQSILSWMGGGIQLSASTKFTLKNGSTFVEETQSRPWRQLYRRL